MTRRISLILSCEHAGNSVPPEYRQLFDGCGNLLESHRGYDPGAIEIARFLSSCLGAPLIAQGVTRLLVEPNRSMGHPQLFSEITSPLDPLEKQRILDAWYHPHRNAVEAAVRTALALPGSHPAEQGRLRSAKSASRPSIQTLRSAGERLVVHIGVHTFTPVLNGDVRNADSGLLYDPARRRERLFCLEWRRVWREMTPGIAIRRNYPYRGIADSLVLHLRRALPESAYLGIELEVNQRHLGTAAWRKLKEDCARSLEATILSARNQTSL